MPSSHELCSKPAKVLLGINILRLDKGDLLADFQLIIKLEHDLVFEGVSDLMSMDDYATGQRVMQCSSR